MRLLATKDGFASVQPTPQPQTDLVRRSWMKRLGGVLGLGLLGGPALASARALSPQSTNASEPFLGEIMIFAGNFEVRGWAFCNGQIISIAQNTALFAILGTTYGGNGQTTFALPDLRGRFPMHFGQGPGLSPYDLGQQAGSETATLITSQMPAHAHTLGVSTDPGTTNSPGGNVLAVASGIIASSEGAVGVNAYGPSANAAAGSGAIGVAGGSQPHSIQNPYLALNFQIALEGIFPSRN